MGLAAPEATWYQGFRPMACCIQVIFSHCTCVHVSLSTSPPVSPEFAFQDQKHRSCSSMRSAEHVAADVVVAEPRCSCRFVSGVRSCSSMRKAEHLAHSG